MSYIENGIYYFHILSLTLQRRTEDVTVVSDQEKNIQSTLKMLVVNKYKLFIIPEIVKINS